MPKGQAGEIGGLLNLVYNWHQLSLIDPQLKVGTANQRHPFSPAAILLSTSKKGNRSIKWNKER
jgi:hypothetical protein